MLQFLLLSLYHCTIQYNTFICHSCFCCHYTVLGRQDHTGTIAIKVLLLQICHCHLCFNDARHWCWCWKQEEKEVASVNIICCHYYQCLLLPLVLLVVEQEENITRTCSSCKSEWRSQWGKPFEQPSKGEYMKEERESDWRARLLIRKCFSFNVDGSENEVEVKTGWKSRKGMWVSAREGSL